MDATSTVIPPNNQGPSNAPNTVPVAPVVTPTATPVATPTATPAATPAATPSTGAAETPEDQVAQSLGYGSYADAVSALTAAPTTNETKLYNDAYSAAGLDTLTNTITGKQNDLVTAQGNINDNPWLDEADRVGRNKTVTDMATADIKNYQDEYNTKLQEVHDLVTRETADGTASTAANKAKLAALEAQAKAAASAATAKQKAPTTIKSASGATYQWDPTTNSFRQLFPGKATTGSSSSTSGTPAEVAKISSIMQSVAGPDGYISPQDWQDALNEWTAAGKSASSFATNFKGYANTKDKTNNYAGL